MRHVTIALPDELSAALAAPGQDLSRAAFEALALAAYRERKISAAQLRHLLGYDPDGRRCLSEESWRRTGIHSRRH
jgi:hypothetical protein